MLSSDSAASPPPAVITNDTEADNNAENVDDDEQLQPILLPLITYKQHVIDVTNLTYPIILTEIFQNIIPLVDIAFVGQLGKDELAAAALATAWFNIWNFCMIGFLTATDTMLAQSYGAKQYNNYALWTGNSLVVIVPITVITSGAIALCGPCMKLFGQDYELSNTAAQFSYRLLPGLLPYYLFKVLTKYLQSQNLLAPGVWIGILANGLNALFNWTFIYRAKLGLMGSPWATSLVRVMELLLILTYMYIKKSTILKETWPKISRTNLQYSILKPFWKLGMEGALALGAEAWSFEVTTILAGLLGTVALDAHIITLTFSSFIYLSFPFAFGIATSIRVGQLIGDHEQRRALDAQRSANTSFVLVCTMQLILVAFVLPCKDFIGKTFSNDADVQEVVASLMPISCLFMMGDAIQSQTSGSEFIWSLFDFILSVCIMCQLHSFIR
jgi:MATE family multidrug resistance protein